MSVDFHLLNTCTCDFNPRRLKCNSSSMLSVIGVASIFTLPTAIHFVFFVCINTPSSTKLLYPNPVCKFPYFLQWWRCHRRILCYLLSRLIFLLILSCHIVPRKKCSPKVEQQRRQNTPLSYNTSSWYSICTVIYPKCSSLSLLSLLSDFIHCKSSVCLTRSNAFSKPINHIP